MESMKVFYGAQPFLVGESLDRNGYVFWHFFHCDQFPPGCFFL